MFGIFGRGAPAALPGPTIHPVLRAEFVYADELAAHPLTKGKVSPPVALLAAEVAALAVDVVVSLAAKAAESLIDAASAKTQPHATNLEITVPLEGFYDGGGTIAVDNGCLVLHSGTDSQAANATLYGIFQVHGSKDRSAFRFSVIAWQHAGFVGKPDSVLQTDRRDVVLKIELLAPGNSGLGTRAAFIEHTFPNVDPATLGALFVAKQELPWFSCPARPSTDPGVRCMPLNLKVSYVESSKPNQFALWVQEIAKDKKSDISTLVKESVRSALDPGLAAGEDAKRAYKAGTTYAAYKTEWDEVSKLKAAKPQVLPTPTPDQQAAIAKWTSDLMVRATSLKTKKLLAVTAFDAAGLPWPGDLPAIAAV